MLHSDKARLSRDFFLRRDDAILKVGNVAAQIFEQLQGFKSLAGHDDPIDRETFASAVQDIQRAVDMTERALIMLADQMDAMWFVTTGEPAPSTRAKLYYAR